MQSTHETVQQINDIKSMMEKSSKFISLSGLSGIAAGVTALVGAYITSIRIDKYYISEYRSTLSSPSALLQDLVFIASSVFIVAFIFAFLFTYRKSKKMNIPIWGSVSKRLLWNTCLPMLVGGIFIIKSMQLNQYDLIGAACLLFYGLGLINGSKYTLGEIRYLGYLEIGLGIMALFFVKHSLMLWTLGFGICHIIYGIAMWWKYERMVKDME